MSNKPTITPALIILSSAILSGCNLAPRYTRPYMEIPADYKEAGDWVLADPCAFEVNDLNWWEIYKDPVLNELEESMPLANPDLKAAIARYDGARSLAADAFSGLFPTLSAVGIPTRQQSSKDTANPTTSTLYNDFLAALSLTYEVDLWGKYRNTFYAATSEAKASAADLAAINLSLQADIAAYYFTLRAADLLQVVLDENVEAYRRALFIYQKLFDGGGAPIATYFQAETNYENAKTLATDNRLKRAELEHAIAVLVGKVPAEFNLPIDPLYKQDLVAVKPYLPSVLTQRRPDVAAAELRVEAANANIGIARAAYFPSINLNSNLGYESRKLVQLLTKPSLIWSVGPAWASSYLGTQNGYPINQVLIDFGAIASLNDLAWAQYHETVFNYQQAVLNAFQEVEDNLVAMHRLAEENTTQTRATDFAYKTAQQSVYRHNAGLVTYLEVASTLESAYQMDISAINIRTQHLVASVQLIRALGGGWNFDDIKPLDLKFRPL